MSKKFRKDVGALGLNSLVNVLKTDYSDTEIISYVLDTLCNVGSPEDWEEDDDRPEEVFLEVGDFGELTVHADTLDGHRPPDRVLPHKA